MGCGQSKPKLPHVVIIGGGYAGTYLAYLLQQETICKVTLVDPKDVFIHRAGVMRSIVEPGKLTSMKSVSRPSSLNLNLVVMCGLPALCLWSVS